MSLTAQMQRPAELEVPGSEVAVPLDVTRPATGLLPLLYSSVVGGIMLVGVLAIAYGLVWSGTHLHTVPVVMILAACALGAIRMDAYGSWIKLSIIPVIAAAYLAGPAGGALAGCASALGGCIQERRVTRRTFLNVCVSSAAGFSGGALALPYAHLPATTPLPFILCGVSATLATYAVNALAVSVILARRLGTSAVALWRERFSWMAPQNLLLGQVGIGMAVAYRYAGAYEIIAFAMPIAAAQLAWKQYLAHTARSVEDLRIKNADLVQLAARLQAANDAVMTTYRGTLEALVGALDARDNEVQGHSYRVSAYSQVVAEAMGVERGSADWDAILRGSLLHDVGKIGVRDAVLLKPGKLDEQEWREMQTHSEIGFGILSDVEFLRPAAALVRAHHEKFDGTGYPLGLAGEEIPLGARIFSVCDTFDAITSDRPYRRAAPPTAAVAEIRRCTGTQFDPEVVAVFERVWPQFWALRAKAAEMVA